MTDQVRSLKAYYQNYINSCRNTYIHLSSRFQNNCTQWKWYCNAQRKRQQCDNRRLTSKIWKTLHICFLNSTKWTSTELIKQMIKTCFEYCNDKKFNKKPKDTAEDAVVQISWFLTRPPPIYFPSKSSNIEKITAALNQRH